MYHAQCTNISTHENAPFAAGDVPFANGNASFTDRGCALCGWKRLLYGWGCAFYGWKRRCADVRAGTQAPPLPFLVWLRVPRLPARCSPLHKHDGIVVARCSPPIIRAVYRRKGARRRYSALFIAGKVLAADIPRRLSQEKSSPPIFRAVYRRKTVRRRYSALFIAGKGARRRTKTENTSQNAYFRRGFSAEYAKKMAFLAFGLRNPTFFYYFCG